MIFSTKADRARIARLENELDRYREPASGASETDRRQLERQVRLARTFPLSIWLFCATVVAPLLAWALLKRHGHSTAGVLAGLAVAVVEGLLVLRRRSRAA
jgi:hypothetical protein